ncbi:NAD-dependent epimerase/dehydratase family protein [bacterium]|nr:NAD-dependent epimerase/dehydratase family protein [bacterium]
MKVLLTGSSGCLGGSLAKLLKNNGFELIATLRSNPSESLTKLADKILRGDLIDPEFVDKCVSNADAVIHTAGKSGSWGSYQSYFDANVKTTQNLISSCKKYGVKYFIYTSSPSCVFDMKDQNGIDETTPYPKKFSAFYPRTKAEAEQIVIKEASNDFMTVSLRPHLIWGPGDRNLYPRIVARAKEKKPMLINNGKNKVDATFVDNVAHAHVLALQKLSSPDGNICNGKKYFITNDEPMEVKEIMNSLLKYSGIELIKFSIPEPIAYLAGCLSEAFYFLSGRKDEPNLTRFVVKELSCNHWFNISAAKKDLGYSPLITMEEGFKIFGKWVKENGLV